MNPLMIDNQTKTNSPIIVVLDYQNERDALNMVAKLDPRFCKLKIGKELFTAVGPKFVEKLIISGYDVFLDLKFYDIPNTVYKACKVAADIGVWMVDVHASGGQKMLEAARLAIDESKHKPLLVGVTVLTSMSEEDIEQVGIFDGINKQIERLARLSYQCKLDGIVCSAHEAKMIKEYTNLQFLTVTPGIRLPDSPKDDQTRIMTPVDAIKNLSDYLVIGRPITKANDPQNVLLNIISQINSHKNI